MNGLPITGQNKRTERTSLDEVYVGPKPVPHLQFLSGSKLPVTNSLSFIPTKQKQKQKGECPTEIR